MILKDDTGNTLLPFCVLKLKYNEINHQMFNLAMKCHIIILTGMSDLVNCLGRFDV